MAGHEERVWEPPRDARSRPRRALIALVAIATTLAAALIALLAHDSGSIEHRGRTIDFPLPLGSVKLGSGPSRASYLMMGYPDLKGVFSGRGAEHGWMFCDQLGSMYRFSPTDPDTGVLLDGVTELKTTYFTRVDFIVRDDPGGVVARACLR